MLAPCYKKGSSETAHFHSYKSPSLTVVTAIKLCVSHGDYFSLSGNNRLDGLSLHHLHIPRGPDSTEEK